MRKCLPIMALLVCGGTAQAQYFQPQPFNGGGCNGGFAGQQFSAPQFMMPSGYSMPNPPQVYYMPPVSYNAPRFMPRYDVPSFAPSYYAPQSYSFQQRTGPLGFSRSNLSVQGGGILCGN